MDNLNTYSGSSKDVTMNMVRILSKQKEGLKVCHINAQSLNNKSDEFKIIFENSNVDVVCVSETWLSKSTSDHFICPNGYRIFRSDRESNTKGGGVAVFVKKHIVCKFRCKNNKNDKVEHVFVEITSHGRKLLLGCVYRPNKDINFCKFFEELEEIVDGYNDIIICGDFNANIIRDTSLTDHMVSFGLEPTNRTIATHFSSVNNSLLDLFFVSDISNVLLYDQISASCFSKHDLIFLTYDFHIKPADKTYTYRDFNNINYDQLYANICLIEWDRIYYMTSVNDQLDFLQDSLLQLYDLSVPIKTKTSTVNIKPWFSTIIKRAIIRRDVAYSRWKRFKTSVLKIEYHIARNEVNREIRIAKSNYYSNQFGTALESKHTWKTIKDIGIGKNDKNVSCTLDADELNIQFTNLPLSQVDGDLYNNISSELFQSNFNNETSFDFCCVNQHDVVKSFSMVKSNAIGYDNIHPKFVKILLPFILPYITHLFNHIITTSSFPCRWKHSKIIPIPKSNSEYRPIAILCYLSKVFEKLLHLQMSSYITEHNLISDKQSGFRPNHSCITALTDVCENIRRDIDDGKVNILVLLDHSKAFDTVDPDILCAKLRRHFQFSSTAFQLLNSYLTNRTQSVYVNEKPSVPLRLIRGVPQGSILGPLLFSIYINDLPGYLSHCKIHMYADDVQLYMSCPKNAINEGINKINNDLKQLHRWALANGLCINPNKSKCLLIRKKRTNPIFDNQIVINDKIIDFVPTAKNLGIIFNSTLTWSNHINAIVIQTYVKLRSLWSTQHFTPLNIRILLAKTYLIPVLLYGCELFAKCDSKSTNKLNVVFNSVIRYVYGLRRFVGTSSHVKKLFGVSLENLMKIRVLLFLHKIIHTKKPSYLYEKIQFARSNRGQKVILPRHRCLVSEWHFYLNACRLWNILPQNQQLNSNASHFKKFLFENFFIN